MAVDWNRLVVGPTVTIFGDQVSYLQGERAFVITGVFDEEYLEITPLGRGGEDMETFAFGAPGAISSQRPVLGVQLSQLPVYPCQGDTFLMITGLHAGERFEVKEVRPDGHGHATLLLNEYSGR